MKNLKNSILFKISVITILILLLLIPNAMVNELIREREYVQRSAIREVSSKWGNGQTITGPFITIPYDRYVKQFSAKDSTEEIVKIREWMYFLPEELNVNGSINPEKRYRGIYEVVVYESQLQISGTFTPINYNQFEIQKEHIHFDKAALDLGISDLKGIERQIQLQWNDAEVAFNSGTTSAQVISNGINALVPVESNDSLTYRFSMSIDLKGSQNLYFIPVGKTTDVTMESNWTTPSFTGTYLPDDRKVSTEGFYANWNILHLNRNYPQSWAGTQYNMSGSSFGTDLLLPVDNYKKSHRVARYSILFLVLTFVVFFFVEVLNKVFIHPIQYLLVGIALLVFYSLLLSMSEYIKFNWAYIIAAILTLGLITGYTSAILKSKKVGLLIFGILMIMYAFIFTIIQLEDYALLIGSLGVFCILGVVMYFSRKIDWYNIRIGNGDQTPAPPDA